VIREAILRWARNRKPDFVIGGPDDPYLERHWLLPRNRFFNVYVHRFLRSDDDRAMHDHPWINASWLLQGSYLEHTRTGVQRLVAGDRRLRLSGRFAHRVELDRGECWTLFVTGPRYRQWGFLCPKGWVHWKDFCDITDSGTVGRGCD
jgi:hypothetical protein